MTEQLKVVVFGASGYTSGELLRLLQQHPQVQVSAVISNSQPGVPLRSLHPQLGAELGALKTIAARGVPNCDCFFFATPAGIAMKYAKQVLAAGSRLIDLSPDFRFKDAKLWQTWYGSVHESKELLSQAVYGLPEAFGPQLQQANLVANPGCYATAIQLALLPLVSNPKYAGVFRDNEIIADAKSGVSGAGRRAAQHLLLGEAGEDFSIYAAESHRHQPEMEAALQEASGTAVRLRFVPHLLPVVRGIFADVYVPLRRQETRADVDLEEIRQDFQAYYAPHPFVEVLGHGELPHIKAVRGSNYCRLGLFAAPNSAYLQICSVLDNLVKGAAGQAIQNMNLVYGLPESTGLTHTGLAP